jgi:2-(1,2-epoxy-1,2-dihydrophenyl)acetyl-CoA isomerase
MSAVLYDVGERVATITFNRPESLNAINPAMIDELLAASVRAAGDDQVRAVIVRGAGEHFMAGGDVKWFREQLPAPDRRQRFAALLDGVQAAVLNFRRMDKPVIAQVHGAVAGFGLSLMLAADLVLASENSYFTLAYSAIALSPDGGATWSLPRHVGLKRAMALALLGERFDAVRACELGLVNRLVAPGQLADEAQKLAQRLACGPALALAHTKALINQSFENSLETQLLAEQGFFAECAEHPDFAEGLAGFFEKRRPLFGKG